MKRPQLVPALTRLQRDRQAVQLGLDPGRAVVVSSERSPLPRVLALFDGTRSERSVVRDAARLGLSAPDIAVLLDRLRARGLLCEAGSLLPRRLPPGTRRRLAPEAAALSLRRLPHDATPAGLLHRRRHSRVVVDGRSRLAGPLAAHLAAAGVGHLHPTAPGSVLGGDPAVGGVLSTDSRRPYRRAMRDAILRAAPDTDTRALSPADADLLVLVGRPRPAPATPLARALRSVRHLTVWVRDGTVVIGPLVRPGRTACLHCVDLHRQDRDPHWPVLGAQLATMPDPVETAEMSALSMAGAVAAGQALTELDGGEPDILGGTLEIAAPVTVRRRSWPPHPRCGCLRRPGGAAVSVP